MDEKTKKILEDAYIADGAYCGCKQGEFAQPVKATHSTNVKLQGLKIMTCADSKVMKNVLDFGMCQLFGQCRLIEIAGQNIKWENFKSDVKIKGSKALNGASYFRCPFAAEEKINFYDHQQNKLDEDGKIRAKTTGEKLEEAGDYLGKSIKQVFLGEFTADEDRTFLGSMAEIALGFTGFDVIMDIRDMAACAMKGDWLGFGLSAIGVIPIIGGGIKAFNTARKGGNAVAEIAENAGKWAKSLKPAEAAKDMVKNAGQAAETIADVSTAAFKGGVKGVIKSAKYIKAFSEAPSLKRLADDILAAGKKIVVAGKDAVPKIKAKICEVKTSLGFNGCFSEETLVRTPNGYVKIENIKKGELIYSYNLLTEEIELKPVLEVLKTYNQGNTLKLKFKENVEIETTFNHEFMTSDGEWITAEELELETKVCTITGERISLEAKEIVRNVNPKIMYDLEIEGNHNYFVSERDLLVHFLEIITNNISEREHMTDKKQRLMLLFLLTLFLGGCSLFTDKAAERREMIQIAESTKMERAIKHLLISIDPKAFTSEGVIHSYTLIKGELEYNPMGGMNVTLVINGDKKLTIDTTVQMEDSGQFEAGSYGISAKLDDLLSKAEETGK